MAQPSRMERFSSGGLQAGLEGVTSTRLYVGIGIRDRGRSGRWWKKLPTIERGENDAQHHHADGQPEDPRRNVINLIEADIAIAICHPACPLRSTVASSPA
jgi:hypothetical protein